MGRYMEHKMKQIIPFDPPTEFEIIETKGFFNKAQNYPILCFMIIDGQGELHISNKPPVPMKKGDVICLPNHFTYMFYINGYLKVVIPK